jgi:hypothetical protein
MKFKMDVLMFRSYNEMNWEVKENVYAEVYMCSHCTITLSDEHFCQRE